MADCFSYICEWVTNYARNKDIVAKNIISIEKNAEGVLVKFKNSELFYLVIPSITGCDELIQKIRERPSMVLVLINSRDNSQIISQNWKEFIDFPQFAILFINPFSQLETRWVINPYVHNKICDNVSLQAGLKSMFASVEPISEDQFKRLVSNA